MRPFGRQVARSVVTLVRGERPLERLSCPVLYKEHFVIATKRTVSGMGASVLSGLLVLGASWLLRVQWNEQRVEGSPRLPVAMEGNEAPTPIHYFPLPPGTVFERHVVLVEGGDVSAGPTEQLIFSNTLGTVAVALGANQLVADDITTTVPGGCNLLRYEFPVVGKVNLAGVGGPYTADFALYTSCPQSVPAASRPGLIIPGTAGQANFPDDSPYLVSFLTAVNVPIPTNLWFGVKFSRANAGVVVGTPPLAGFSCDQFDPPGFPCNGNLGVFPDYPQASFNLEIYADSACASSFTAYKNDKPSGSIYNPGVGVWLADDIQLSSSACSMVGYEVGIKGVGLYSFEIRNNCDSSPIPGTQKAFVIPSGTDTRIVRFAIDPPVALPQSFWFAAKVNNTTGGVVITGKQACIGSTGDLLCEEPGPTIIDVPGAGVHAAFDLAITCDGPAPLGACCDMFITDPAGDAVCRAVPQTNCPFPPRFSALGPAWVQGAACAPDPFTPQPCGKAACCKPDDSCQNLTLNECNAVLPLASPRQWQRGQYCNLPGQRCPRNACLGRTGECTTQRCLPNAGVCDTKHCVGGLNAGTVCTTNANCQVCSNKTCSGAPVNTVCTGTGQGTCPAGQTCNFITCTSDSTCTPVGNGTCPVGGVCGTFNICTAGMIGQACTSDFQCNCTGGICQIDPTCCDSCPPVGCEDEFCCTDVCDQDVFCCQTEWDQTCADRARDLCDVGLDCNGNGIPDADDIASGFSFDCNANEIPDECDIASGASQDCNANGIPDECEPFVDCNNNAVLDECDISLGTSLDCNGNGVPDECEPDCNANAIADECDIASCAGAPSCDDCNLNGVPDVCDIGGVSLDVDPPDGVPDECDHFTGFCAPPASNQWSCPQNWSELPPDTYPDDVNSADGVFVQLDAGDDVFLDVDSTIPALDIDDGATLRVNQSGAAGDLSFSAPGAVEIKGSLLVANDRTIGVGGSLAPSLTISNAGVYKKDPDSTVQTTAVLNAAQVRLLTTIGTTEQMTLTEGMRVTTVGDLILDGRGFTTLPAAAEGSVAGGRTPPIIRMGAIRMITGSAAAAVGGDLAMVEAAEVCVGCVPTQATDDAPTVELHGDFVNQAQYASTFDWTYGVLRIAGTGSPPPVSHTIEVAGLDLGGSPAGFETGQSTLTETFVPPATHTNFSMGTIIVDSFNHVTFVNEKANTAGKDPCQEALYVNALVLEPNSSITVDNCTVYTRLVRNNGGSISTTGCGQLVVFDPWVQAAPAQSALWDANSTAAVNLVPLKMNRYLGLRVPDSGGRLQAVRVEFKSLPPPWDAWNGTKMFLTNPTTQCETAGVGPGQPCAGAPSFPLSSLTCDPGQAGFLNWSAVAGGVVYVTHPGIVPRTPSAAGEYEVRVVDAASDLLIEAAYSSPMTVAQGRWGDVAGPFDILGGYYVTPDGTVGVGVDVTGILNKFANRGGAPIKVRADVEPCQLDVKVNISDVTQVLNAFRQLPFPYSAGGGFGCLSTDPCAYDAPFSVGVPPNHR